MKKVVKYFKRLIKYVLYEHKQPIIYTNVYEKSQNEIHLNKVYIVTGGGGGLGYYITKSLISSGATVIITGRNEEKLKKSCEELGKKCKYIKMDIRNIAESKEKLNKLLSDRTGQSIETIERDTERDHYMTAEEALKYGLIDGIMDKRK